MIITTTLDEVNRERAQIGVSIKGERRKIKDGAPDLLNDIVGDMFETMEISSILKALKDYNESAFNMAMEHFIEKELAEAEKESEDE